MEKCGKYKNLDFVSELSDKIIWLYFWYEYNSVI